MAAPALDVQRRDAARPLGPAERTSSGSTRPMIEVARAVVRDLAISPRTQKRRVRGKDRERASRPGRRRRRPRGPQGPCPDRADAPNAADPSGAPAAGGASGRRAGGRHRASRTPYRRAVRSRHGVAALGVTVSRPGGRGPDRLRDRVEEGRDSTEQGAGSASRGDPQDSATERKPPMAGPAPAQVRVKRCGKSAPAAEATSAGSVNPTRSKAKRGRRAARPVPERGRSPGGPLRWMATPVFCLSSGQGTGQNPAYRPAHRQQRFRPHAAPSQRRCPTFLPFSDRGLAAT